MEIKILLLVRFQFLFLVPLVDAFPFPPLEVNIDHVSQEVVGQEVEALTNWGNNAEDTRGNKRFVAFYDSGSSEENSSEESAESGETKGASPNVTSPKPEKTITSGGNETEGVGVTPGSLYCLTCTGSKTCPAGMVMSHTGTCVPKANWKSKP